MSKLNKPSILITGATGNVGSATLKLISQDGGYNVRVGVRRGSARAETVKKLPNINEVCEYDASIVDEDFGTAMANLNYLLLVPPNSSSRMVQVKNYIQLAKENNVAFILFFSMFRPNSVSKKRYHQEYDGMEGIVESCGIPYAFIRGSLHHQTLFLFVPDIWRNALPLPWGAGKIAMLNVFDIASFARMILNDPIKHNGRAYHLTGSEIFSGEDIANIASEELGAQVKYVNVYRDSCKRLLLDSGVDDTLAEEFLEIFDEIKQGLFDNLNFSELLETMLGRKPTTLRSFLKDHASRFKYHVPGAKPPYGPAEGIGEMDVWAQVSQTPLASSAKLISAETPLQEYVQKTTTDVFGLVKPEELAAAREEKLEEHLQIPIPVGQPSQGGLGQSQSMMYDDKSGEVKHIQPTGPPIPGEAFRQVEQTKEEEEKPKVTPRRLLESMIKDKEDIINQLRETLRIEDENLREAKENYEKLQ